MKTSTVLNAIAFLFLFALCAVFFCSIGSHGTELHVFQAIAVGLVVLIFCFLVLAEFADWSARFNRRHGARK